MVFIMFIVITIIIVVIIIITIIIHITKAPALGRVLCQASFGAPPSAPPADPGGSS